MELATLLLTPLTDTCPCCSNECSCCSDVQVVDLADNRVEMNLKMIRGTMLVDLPNDRSFTFEEFITTQAKFQKKQAELMSVRNEEVSGALGEPGVGELMSVRNEEVSGALG